MSSILGLDVGQKRIGVAISDEEVGLPSPHATLSNDDHIWDVLIELIKSHETSVIVVGLPRNMAGEETAQTRYTTEFIEQLTTKTDVPIKTQDESLTSVKAEKELRARGKEFSKEEVDALAATYILEDYLGLVSEVPQ